MSDKSYENYFPFVLHHDSVTNRWCVVLTSPDDPDDFVVPYDNEKFENCVPVCDALNNIIQKHIRHFVEVHKEQWIAEELGDE